MVLRHGSSAIAIDCGMLPSDGDHGVDRYLPDLSFVGTLNKELEAVVLTHAHLDHIGAVSSLLRRRNVPVYGGDYTLACLRRLLDEEKLEHPPEFRAIASGNGFQIGPFAFQAIPVTHSISEAFALLIKTPNETLLHTGDLRLDPEPYVGDATSEETLQRIGDRGVDVLMSDSTNVALDQTLPTETAVAACIKDALHDCQGAVYAGVFASHLPRLQAFIDAAKVTGRRLCVTGRSLINQVELAFGRSLFERSQVPLLTDSDLKRVPRKERLVLATGTQANPGSALHRLSHQLHPTLQVEAGDRVLLSSRMIPGNERVIGEMLDRFVRLGADVRAPTDTPLLHASGHGSRPDLVTLMKLVRPKTLMPIHGSPYMRHIHQRVARQHGLTSSVLAEDGDVLELREDALVRVGKVPAGRIAISGRLTVSRRVLQQRQKLGESGIAFVVAEVSHRSAIRLVDITTVGVALQSEGVDLFRKISEEIKRSYHRKRNQLHELIEHAARKVCVELTGRRVTVQVVLTNKNN